MIDGKMRPEEFEQLALDLLIEEEPDADGSISTEERMRRSETARVAMEMRIRGDEKTGVWVEDYYTLKDAGFPWRVAAFIAWSASPKIGRVPKTQEELAVQVLGLTSDRQIATWRKRNPSIDDTIGMMQALPLMEHRRDYFEALAESASNPDHRHHQDRKLAFEMTKDYTPRIKVEDVRHPVDPVEMNEADLAAVEKAKKG